MNALSIKALIIREYWENRGLLFKTPLVISLILLLLASVGTYQAVQFAPWGHDGGKFQYEHSDGSSFKFSEDLFRDENGKSNFDYPEDWGNSDMAVVKSTIVAGIVSIALAVSFFLSLFYLSSSLYQDRKDRSILFWRSLPVSEWETIVSKLVTGVWLFPLIYCGFALVATLLCTIIVYLGAVTLGVESIVRNVLFEIESYSLTTFLRILVMQIVFTTSLIPMYSWVMLSSAFSKRGPMLLAIGIPLGTVIVEGVLLHSRYVATAFLEFFTALFFNAEAISAFNFSDVNWGVYILAALISALFLVAAHWCRNHRYEI